MKVHEAHERNISKPHSKVAAQEFGVLRGRKGGVSCGRRRVGGG